MKKQRSFAAQEVFLKYWNRKITIHVSLFLSLSLAACGLTTTQKAALTQFGAATSDFSTIGRSEFVHSRDEVIEMNRSRLELGDDSININQLDGLLTVERVQDRLVALAALQEYAQLLEKLVSTFDQGELKGATDSFLASLRRVKGVNLQANDAEAIGKAVVLVGGVFLEYKRAKAVRQVVEFAHPYVITTVDLVQRDFDPTTDYWNAGYRQVTLDLKGAAVEAKAKVQEGDLASHQIVARALILSNENWGRFQKVSSQIIVTTARLRTAQENLRAVMSSREIGIQDIEGYANQVQEFVTIYRLLRGQAG